MQMLEMYLNKGFRWSSWLWPSSFGFWLILNFDFFFFYFLRGKLDTENACQYSHHRSSSIQQLLQQFIFVCKFLTKFSQLLIAIVLLCCCFIALTHDHFVILLNNCERCLRQVESFIVHVKSKNEWSYARSNQKHDCFDVHRHN